ncbi:hypothetical protein [Aliiroseovarius lamellibrachiae]|uniref:hypothetical protein n=1 Tax=Aliiroseovarius lamellibrachiae TaxID=1924933 RepID=UPI001BE054E4|nr:hypothetical protein [Aliiroseovarius lamellibrachiae]MBT2131388.1 hypothetical protein [Aliiroseovarius lamellibrachiae]
MNKFMIAATVLMFATFLAHVLGGGPEIHAPIQASDLSPYLRAISAVIWHAITIILLVFSVALAGLIKYPNRALERVIIAIQLGFASLFLFYGMRLLGNVIDMPQWIAFMLIPAVMVIGRRGKTA